ncbi:putative ABC transporter ATP-binding protein [Eubacteriaceae bacterium CHKCI005]|nr:putative ABC transporter ATP-binding protein [Eubacteriaceae bacterium CHKCI005]
MSIVQISHLTFCYDGSSEDVFTDVSFQFDTCWRLGCTGRNGRGKTTLLRLLSGCLDSGGAITLGGVRPVCFPFSGFDASLTPERLFTQWVPNVEPWRILCELSQLSLSEEVLHRPYHTLSGGEQTKLQLACLFSSDAVWPLIDEPTNHLDAMGREAVSQYLSSKDGFLLISHDRAFLDSAVDHMLVLERQKLEVLRGGYSTWAAEKQRRERWEAARNAQLKKEISRLDAAAKRAAQWSAKAEGEKFVSKPGQQGNIDRGYLGHKAAKMMKRSKSTEARLQRAAEEKRGLLRDVETSEALRLSPLPWRKSSSLISLEDVVLSYGGRQVCGPVNVSLSPGERMALLGPNGCGKSSLLRAVCEAAGYPQPDGPTLFRGKIQAGSGLIVSMVQQDAEGLTGDIRTFSQKHGLDLTLFLTLLRKMGFERSQFARRLEELSSGQKKKALLAASLATPAHLIIWDEPLNYIDILSRLQIEQLICESGASMLFVEHDAAFVQNTATRILRLSEEGQVIQP